MGYDNTTRQFVCIDSEMCHTIKYLELKMRSYFGH